VCICSFRCPAFKVHTPCYIVMFGLSGYRALFLGISKRTRLSGGGGSYWIQNVFWFSLRLVSETFLIVGILRDIIIYRSSCKVPVIPVRIYPNLNFVDRFTKNTQISNIIIISPVGAELFHANRRTDGWTDRHNEASRRFSQFCERA